jgi:orotate phosphoribosyltransferase
MGAASQLAKLIIQRAIVHGTFTLKSGLIADKYIDLMQIAGDPHGSRVLAKAIAARIRNVQHDAVGGPEARGIPLAWLAAQGLDMAYGMRRPKMFFVRKQAKEHGRMLMIEGPVLAGDLAILLEDVITTGGTVLAAMDVLRAAGISVAAVVPVLDRSDGRVEKLVREKAGTDPLYLPILYAADVGLDEVSVQTTPEAAN